jgi:site-specific recombinase XerD
MVVKARPDGKYDLDITLGGRSGKRIREKGFESKEMAKVREAELNHFYYSTSVGSSLQTLQEFIDLWYKLHGHTLRDKYRISRLNAICVALKNPTLSEFNASMFADYRIVRVQQVTTGTVNHELRYLRAVFNEMIRLGYYHSDNPLSQIRSFKEKQTELGFLDDLQIKLLLDHCAKSTNPHLLTVTKICLSTGCRFGEAEYLLRTGLVSSGSKALRFVDTKNGKNRSVPISSNLFNEIKSVSNGPASRKLFNSCRSAFKYAVKKSGIELIEGQLTHVLRHTFASHFVMNGGDIVTLKNILGHSDLQMTMRYAHLSPDYLAQVLDLNPLSNCSHLSTDAKILSFEKLEKSA